VLIGGMALGNIIFSLVYMNFSFLRMGTSGFTAQAFGRRDFRSVTQSLIRALVVGFGIGVLLLALQLPIERFALSLMQGSYEVRSAASEYFYMRIWGAPAAMMIYSLNGWFVGMQNARAPMWIAICSNCVNVVLSLALAFGLDWGIAGVGLGTALSQWFGVAMALVIIGSRYSRLARYFGRTGLFARGVMREFFRVNSDIFIRTFSLMMVMVYFTIASSGMGDEILAANNLMMQLFLVFSYFMDGFAYAGEAMVGRAFGASNFRRVRLTVLWVLFWGFVTALGCTVLYGVFSDWVLMLFNPSSAILDVAHEYLWWAIAVPLAGFLAYLMDGFMVAITATSIMRNSMIVSTALFFGVYFGTLSSLGNDALWLAYILFLVSRGICQFALSYKRLFARA
ncbi:MAG: MATE family efflux transporter, partial [Rikenellaceae bacterium]